MMDSLRSFVTGNFFASMAIAVTALLLGTTIAVKSESRAGWIIMIVAVIFGFFVLKWKGIFNL